MTDLVAFLRARLDEDEANSAVIHVDYCFEVLEPPGVCNCGYPARVLRDVEADRKLLAALEAAQREQPVPDSWGDDPYDPAVSFSAGEYAGLLPAAKFRAAVYSDHPDYDAAMISTSTDTSLRLCHLHTPTHTCTLLSSR